MKLFGIKSPYFSELDSTGGIEDSIDFEDDSFNLGEDGEDNTPPAEEGTEETQDTQLEPYKLKVKYNHEEMELAENEAIPYIQKGMNFDKAVERAAQEARQQAVDEYIANQGYEWNGKQITTQSEYQQALYEQELIEKGANPAEVAQLVNDHPDVRMAREIAEQKAREEQETQEYREFVTEYPDVKPEDIPKEVFQYQAQTGKSLTDSMRWHELKTMREQNKILQQNLENSKKAPIGSVTAQGNEGTEHDPFLEGFNSF